MNKNRRVYVVRCISAKDERPHKFVAGYTSEDGEFHPDYCGPYHSPEWAANRAEVLSKLYQEEMEKRNG